MNKNTTTRKEETLPEAELDFLLRLLEGIALAKQHPNPAIARAARRWGCVLAFRIHERLQGRFITADQREALRQACVARRGISSDLPMTALSMAA